MMFPMVTKGLANEEFIYFLNVIPVNTGVGHDTAWGIQKQHCPSLTTPKKKKKITPRHFLFCCLTRKVWILFTLAFNTEASQAPNIPLQCRSGSAFVLADLHNMLPLLSCLLKPKMDSRNETTIISVSSLRIPQAHPECKQPKFTPHKTDACLQSCSCLRQLLLPMQRYRYRDTRQCMIKAKLRGRGNGSWHMVVTSHAAIWKEIIPPRCLKES